MNHLLKYIKFAGILFAGLIIVSVCLLLIFYANK